VKVRIAYARDADGRNYIGDCAVPSPVSVQEGST
jgi:hypothetical protein